MSGIRRFGIGYKYAEFLNKGVSALVFNKKLVTNRKAHICHGCGEELLRGHRMLRVAGKVDGQIIAVRYCYECEDWLERHDWIDPLELEAGHMRKGGVQRDKTDSTADTY
jgi:hypothetical protein